MIIKINYNKTTGEISVNNDVIESTISINENTIVDADDKLLFEVSLDTSYLQQIEEVDGTTE
tara:strand:+ start:47 stop:232 length:186 start_codon:yes stop_codon:yes gene_type:complete